MAPAQDANLVAGVAVEFPSLSNALGQVALGSCLTLAWHVATADHACHNTPGQSASEAFLTVN